MHTKFLAGNLKGRSILGDQGTDGSIIVKCTFKEVLVALRCFGELGLFTYLGVWLLVSADHSVHEV
jgi:hypothetical protein